MEYISIIKTVLTIFVMQRKCWLWNTFPDYFC